MSQHPNSHEDEGLLPLEVNESESDLQATKEKLLTLKRQLEEFEQKERELEELKHRRSEMLTGQKHMRERLMRALTVLERAEYEARREVEQLEMTRQTFAEHLEALEAINPSEWQPEEMDEAINRALSQIDHASAVYSQARAKIEALSGQDISASEDDEMESENLHSHAGGFYPYLPSFGEMLRMGFAFTLPLIVVLIALIATLVSQSIK